MLFSNSEVLVSALEQQPATTARLRQAGEVKDVEGVVGTLAADAVLRSPITDRVVFRGREEIREVLQSVFASVSDIHYFADVGDQRMRALFYRANVGGEPLEEAMRIELNEDAEIAELTIFYRPLPGLTSFAAAVGPRVAKRRHGRIRSLLARALLAPLALATRLGDRLTPWLA